MAQVGHQPVGHVGHRGRRPHRRRRGPARRAPAAPGGAGAARRSRERRCRSNASPAADQPSSPTTATVSPGRAPSQAPGRGHRDRPTRSPRSPIAGRDEIAADDPRPDLAASSHMPSESAMTSSPGVWPGAPKATTKAVAAAPIASMSAAFCGDGLAADVAWRRPVQPEVPCPRRACRWTPRSVRRAPAPPRRRRRGRAPPPQADRDRGPGGRSRRTRRAPPGSPSPRRRLASATSPSAVASLLPSGTSPVACSCPEATRARPAVRLVPAQESMQRDGGDSGWSRLSC